MYLSFYGLREKPFNTTPDPRFLYPTPGHQEALAQILYGVEERRGFIVLTAEVGTGKTTLLQALLQRLNPDTKVAFVFNSLLPFEGILEYALEDFGIVAAGSSQAQRLFALNNFLIERRRTGQNTVLILDEAQNLDTKTLEQIRLLSNFETPTGKLLQLLLVGQPELRTKLQQPELRQLKQRIGLRCRLPVLTHEETRNYIRYRLRVAGAPDPAIFSDRAALRISAYAGGIPRVINIVCDHCLLIGFAEQQRRIGTEIVEEAIEYLEEGEQVPRQKWWQTMLAGTPLSPQWRKRWTAAAVLCCGVGVLGWNWHTFVSASSLLTEHFSDLTSSAQAIFSKVLSETRDIFLHG
ncbi:MAG TPA: AAA family ATPase [Candidatus Binatia bacterium]|jgi:general secretion pathway protein A|nr:AAA family ATPase [Candidatus Binatia bacterium]